MLLREDVPLAPFTTFKIGGPARWFAEAAAESDVAEAVEFSRSRSLPLFVLGGGSNVLVSDAGFPGLVLHIALKGVQETNDAEHRIFNVAAGEDWDAFVSRTVEADCGGIECLAGIPGTVGGTPVQNVGAYGQEVASTIQSVRVLEIRTGKTFNLDHRACGFAYRKSIFNSSARGKFIVVEVSYKLANHSTPTVSYGDISQYFKDSPEPTLGQVTTAVREIRARKGMLITPGEQDSQSAGSFFKNPVVTIEVLEQIRRSTSAAVNGQAEVPHYQAGAGIAKLPAAWLVEHAGFSKGYASGRAGISSRHTLALINRGGATAADILKLRDQIIAGVQQRFGIVLEPEPVWVS